MPMRCRRRRGLMDGAESECCSGRRKESKAGSMTRAQVFASTTALVAALSVAGPEAAQAGSLLSGYGGPGQGNQAILGSALLNGPRSGGGGSGKGGSGGAAGGSSFGLAESSSQEASSGSGVGRGSVEGVRVTPSENAPPTAGHGMGAIHGASKGVVAKSSRRGAGQASASALSTYPASERGEATVSAGSGAGGLSTQDLLYILLALGVLSGVGLLTRWLTGFAVSRSADG